MIGIAYIILFIYILGLSYILLFCLMQFNLLYHYKKHHRNFDNMKQKVPVNIENLPFVTVQLPVYNEMYVIERLIDNICQFNYPKDKFEIQVLDDSNDATTEKARRKVEEYVAKGFDISLVRREDRSGFKAGALKEGMNTAKGDFIAIFDADFLPSREFLMTTIPYFENPKIGVVQTRWEHINENYSLITRLQAFQLNVHFTVEQQGRKSANCMLQFNGTAGVWRKETIIDAGGWEADTLTEDLDLSYRAQLNGWKIHYLENMVSPAELPVEMNGLKSQQFRWMKGGAETARKMLPTVWKSNLQIFQKIHATVHLMSSSIFLWVFIVGVFSVPTLFLLEPLNIQTNYFAIFFLSLLSIVAVYYVANVQGAWNQGFGLRTILKFILLFPIFLALSMGLSLHNSIAVIQGYIGKKSPFIRTPKFNFQSGDDSTSKKNYLSKKIPLTTILEGILAIYFMITILYSIQIGNTSFLIFHVLLAIGYSTICFYSIKHLMFK